MKRKRLKNDSRYMMVVGRKPADTAKLARTMWNKPGSKYSENEMMVMGFIKKPGKKDMMR
jgi:hypothetical protein